MERGERGGGEEKSNAHYIPNQCYMLYCSQVPGGPGKVQTAGSSGQPPSLPPLPPSLPALAASASPWRLPRAGGRTQLLSKPWGERGETVVLYDQP